MSSRLRVRTRLAESPTLISSNTRFSMTSTAPLSGNSSAAARAPSPRVRRPRPSVMRAESSNLSNLQWFGVASTLLGSLRRHPRRGAPERRRRKMRALVPFAGVGPLKNEMERLFDRFFEPDNGESFAMGEWAPRLDLTETKDALIVKVEVPAIDPKEIQLSIMEGVLTVKGEKKAEEEDKDRSE